MSKKITVQVCINEYGMIGFVNPSCEQMSAKLFVKILTMLHEMENHHNNELRRRGGPKLFSCKKFMFNKLLNSIKDNPQ